MHISMWAGFQSKHINLKAEEELRLTVGSEFAMRDEPATWTQYQCMLHVSDTQL